MIYRKAMTSSATSKIMAKQQAFKAFEKLQIKFKQELSAVNGGANARRGTPLSSPERATNIARSNRSIAKLNVTSQIQANNLVKFTQHAKFLGNGLAVIDFTGRIGSVQASFKSGGEWERDLFIESSSFAFSAGVGMIAVNVGAAALSFFWLRLQLAG